MPKGSASVSGCARAEGGARGKSKAAEGGLRGKSKAAPTKMAAKRKASTTAATLESAMMLKRSVSHSQKAKAKTESREKSEAMSHLV